MEMPRRRSTIDWQAWVMSDSDVDRLYRMQSGMRRDLPVKPSTSLSFLFPEKSGYTLDRIPSTARGG
jgi:hypothetical protein